MTEVHGSGRQKGYPQTYRGAEYTINPLQKVKVEAVMPDALAEQLVEVRQEAARTGKIGDDKIFLSG